MSVLALLPSLPALQPKARRPSRHLPLLVNAELLYLSLLVFGIVLREQDKRYEHRLVTKIANTLIRRYQFSREVAMLYYVLTGTMIIVDYRVTLFGIQLLDKSIGFLSMVDPERKPGPFCWNCILNESSLSGRIDSIPESQILALSSSVMLVGNI